MALFESKIDTLDRRYRVCQDLLLILIGPNIFIKISTSSIVFFMAEMIIDKIIHTRLKHCCGDTESKFTSYQIT